jgi:hypothetical protein
MPDVTYPSLRNINNYNFPEQQNPWNQPTLNKSKRKFFAATRPKQILEKFAVFLCDIFPKLP